MTIRQAAVKGMEELGINEEQANQVLAAMDAKEPHFIAKSNEEIPESMEQEAIEIAKKYFVRKAKEYLSKN